MTSDSKTRWVAGIIVGIALALALASTWTDSLVVDEVPHIGAGYSYVTQLDYRMNPEHPPLVKDLAGLSLLFLHLNGQAFTQSHWTTGVNDEWNFGRSLIFESGNNADLIKFVARLPVLLFFFLIACYFMWRWTDERYGRTAALIALTIFAFSPTVIAHARLVTTDMAAATGILVGTYAFVQYLKKPTRFNFWLAGIVIGLALLCKFSTALLGPFIILVALLWGLDGYWTSSAHWKKALRLLWHTILIGIVALGVVWLVYLVQTWNYPVTRQAADTQAIIGNPGSNPFKIFALWASDKPVIRALGHWTLGLTMVEDRASGGNTIYWMGNVVDSGGPWYFPIVYFLKEPLAWWILAAMALAAVAVHSRRHGKATTGIWWSRNRDEWVWLLWLAMYWAISIHSTLNIGVRYLLPVYPFTIILVSGQLAVVMAWLAQHDRSRLKWYAGIVAILLGWYVFESVSVFPYYLTYFNEIAGGPSGGYRYVTDSNVDWGQDLRRLSVWVTDQHIRAISLDYFGWADPAYYLKSSYVWTTSSEWQSAADFIRYNKSDGWIAISATFLQQAIYSTGVGPGNYRWLLDYAPVTVIGHSIFVWHITK